MLQHTCEYRVIYGDTDQMGVVYHANYLRFFERGRCELMRALAFPYGKVEEAGVLLPVIDAQVSYKQPARFDDLVHIETTVGPITRVRVSFTYRLHREDGTLLATGTTVHACINAQGKPVRVPPFVKDVLGAT